MTTTTTSPASELILLRTGSAAKLGPRAKGMVHYALMADAIKAELFIQITSNDGGGYYSREAVTWLRIAAVLEEIEVGHPFASKVFGNCFTGRSSNNAGFLACILHAEGLLTAVPEKPHLHLLSDSWSQWQHKVLALPWEEQPTDTHSAKPSSRRKQREEDKDADPA